MNATDVPARVWALGERLHATVKRFFAGPLGPDAKPLEIRAAVLEEVERQVTPVGGGRRVFPYQRLVCRVIAPDGGRGRGSCEAAFRDLEERVRTRLAEVRCEPPQELEVRVTVLRKAPADWETGRLFAVDYRAGADASPTEAEAADPILQVTIVAGTATQPSYSFDNPTVLVGRGVEPMDEAGRVRRNHIAFAETAGGAAETVGRAHARFTRAAGEYRVRDEGSSNGTQVIRGGTSITVPARDPRGVRVQSGDEIQFGRARVRIKVRPPSRS